VSLVLFRHPIAVPFFLIPSPWRGLGSGKLGLRRITAHCYVMERRYAAVPFSVHAAGGWRILQPVRRSRKRSHPPHLSPPAPFPFPAVLPSQHNRYFLLFLEKRGLRRITALLIQTQIVDMSLSPLF